MQILTRINWVDVLVVILILRMSYVAFMDGLSHEIFPMFGSIAVLVLSLRYYMVLANTISQTLVGMSSDISNCLSFIILVVGLGFLVRFLRVILDKIVKVQWHPVIEKFGGLFAGIIKAYVVTVIVLTVLSMMPLSYLKWSVMDRSLTGKYIMMAGPNFSAKFKVFLSDNSTIPKKVPAKKEPS